MMIPAAYGARSKKRESTPSEIEASRNSLLREPFCDTRPRSAQPISVKAFPMLEWIVILLVVAAIASLLGFRGVAGASAGIAKILILIVLVGFLLLLFFGVIAFA